MKTARIRIIAAGLLIGLLAGSPAALATTILIEATRDNTLYDSPSGRLSNGSGDHMFVGLTLDQLRRRAVVAFRDLESIPDDALITSVRILFHLSLESSPPTSIELHRLTADWGESFSNALEDESQGANAEVDDATWVHRFSPFPEWRNAGGDFEDEASALFLADAPGFYVVWSTDELVADVQAWIDEPSQNFGWILVGDETTHSLKRFDTRENGNADFRPLLEISYSVTGSGYDFSGPWYDPALDGEGYLVYQTPAGWFVYYFGYSPEGQFLWLTSSLVTLDLLVPGESFEVPMLIGEPGTFEQPTPSDQLKPYGTLSVRFDNCTEGQFVLDGLYGVKTSTVRKIIGVDGTGCENF